MRGYAIGLGAGTQVVTLLLGEIVLGPPTVLARALLMAAAWAIILAVAEWIIQRHLSSRPRSASPAHSVGGDAQTVAAVPSGPRDDRVHHHRTPRQHARSGSPGTRTRGSSVR